MQNNQIETLDEDLFAAQKPIMERIYLSHNKMTEVPTHLFRNMASLNDLRLSDNLILEIDPKAFESEYNLIGLVKNFDIDVVIFQIQQACMLFT